MPAFSRDSTAIDVVQVHYLSALARQSKLSLPAFVRLIRGQTEADPRPNKALQALPVPDDLAVRATYEAWNDIVHNGVCPTWKPSKPHLQNVRPSNHKIPSTHISEVRKHIRQGQLEGRYLVLDTEVPSLWPEIFISPVDVVEKGDSDIRAINNYSFPTVASVNDFTDTTDFPEITYNPPRDIASRIHVLRVQHPHAEVLIMLGDVSGAFRHVPMCEYDVHMFAFLFDDCVVIDLSCGFGWCGSPAYYSVAGKIINNQYECSRPTDPSPLDATTFSGNVWCDDHTCVEVNTGSRCRDANIALRRAMITVLGLFAVNEKKFTQWSTQSKALGLNFDTKKGTVSMPEDKMARAYRDAQRLLKSGRASKTELNKLLGVFRHVVVCFPSARAFYQRIHEFSIRLHSFQKRQLYEGMVDDLRWFRAVLTFQSRFNSIPVEQFAHVLQPSVHVFMDASNTGLCAINPMRHEYIRAQFDRAELAAIRSETYEFSINVRELTSAVLAALHRGPLWQQCASGATTHVRFHIDNIPAVSWSNRRLSSHPRAQMLNRLLLLAELQYQCLFTAEHIPSRDNIMADAGRCQSSLRQSLRHLGSMLCDRALAVTTTTKYRGAWTQWSKFSRMMGWSPWLSGVGRTSGNKLGYFAVYLWKFGWNTASRGSQYPTIQTKISSVIWFHKRYRGIDVIRSPRLRMILQGIKRLSDPVRKKFPVTPAFLRVLRRSITITSPQHRLLWGSVLIAYFFLLRRSEYLVIGHKRSEYCLKYRNVYFSDEKGNPVTPAKVKAVTIGPEGSKNDQYSRGAWRTMHASGDKLLCPVRALRHIKVTRKQLGVTDAEHLCVDLNAATVARMLKNDRSYRKGAPAKLRDSLTKDWWGIGIDERPSRQSIN